MDIRNLNAADIRESESELLNGANREGSTVSQSLRDFFWLQGMMGGLKAEYDSVKAFAETDQTNDLKSVTISTLILHGDDDQIVPIAGVGGLQAKLI